MDFMFGRWVLLGTLCVFLSPSGVRGQGYATIELAGVQRARVLGAVVRDASGAPVEGMLVEECTPDWKTLLRSTKTDANGKFAFPRDTGGPVHYFQFTGSGFDPFRVRMKMDRMFGKTVALRMKLAT
jgi:hypothetical protein